MRLLRFAEPREPDVSPSGGTHSVFYWPPLPHESTSRASDPHYFTRYKFRLFILGAPCGCSSPPAVNATSPVELQSAAWGWRRTARPERVAEARPKAPPHSVAFVLSSSGRSLRGLKRAWRVAGLRGRRLRPARLCESQEHSPKLAPVPCPVSASLRLRCRSATLPSPAAILAELAHRQPAEYAILRGRETKFSAESICSRALENLIQKRTSLLNDFPVKALARGRALSRLKLPCAGGVRVTPAGRSDTAYRLINSAQFLVRACAIHSISAHRRNS